MARVLRQTGWQFEEILCSPLRRTVQTAELYGAGLGTSAKNAVQAVPFLAPTADRTRAIEHLGEMGIRGAALWVFHMPDVAEVARGVQQAAPGKGRQLTHWTMPRAGRMIRWRQSHRPMRSRRNREESATLPSAFLCVLCASAVYERKRGII